MTVKERLSKLREIMNEQGLDAYMIPSADPHISEYVADYYKCRAFMSGFTGSAGTLIVTTDSAYLWTDGRYFIQAEIELEDSGIHLFKMGQKDVPRITKWINDIEATDYKIGYDATLFSSHQMSEFKKVINNEGIHFNPTMDLIDAIWIDRPSLPMEKVFEHTVEYTGKTVAEKLDAIRRYMKNDHADYYLMSSLNDIAWLFNIRGYDIAYTPVVYAYGIISREEALLFVDETKIESELATKLDKQGVKLMPYAAFYSHLETLDECVVAYDNHKVNEAMVNCLHEGVTIREIADYTSSEKSVMNEVEIKNYLNCNVKDGVAMVRFLSWIDENVGNDNITEMSASKQLEAFRSEQEGFIEPSFETIPAYGSNAAMMHYSASEEQPVKLEAKGLFLVDSGGQYYDGTTDITRTICLGELTDEERKDFTLVLKGNIALSKAVFLDGTTGTQLDVLARQPIWNERMDYKCGTGHAVGYLLGVHEGPQRISPAVQSVKLKPGMIITNEPGIYKQDKHGIRIENILLIKEDSSNEMGTFNYFEPLTLCPIDKRALDINLLTDDELGWLNDYHKKVYNALSDCLNKKDKEWLKEATAPF